MGKPPLLPVPSRQPWYKRKWIWVLLLTLSTYLTIQYLFYRPIKVTRGPWQVLEPGQPVIPLKFEVVEEGTGPIIEPGDLIQVSLWGSNDKDQLERRSGDWWIWIGFRTNKETPFHTIDYSEVFLSPNFRFVSAFVGLREGSIGGFLEEINSSISAGSVFLNPFGAVYRHPKKKSRGIQASPVSEYTSIHIKKVFKGQLNYRTTHLYDDTWFHYCYNWFSCEYTNSPREALCDDAIYEGVSADGQRATFHYGPEDAPSNPHPGSCNIQGWAQKEWEKLPIGVQVK